MASIYIYIDKYSNGYKYNNTFCCPVYHTVGRKSLSYATYCWWEEIFLQNYEKEI